MSFEFYQLAQEYAEAYPNEPSLLDYLNEFGDERLVEIMKEAKGRKIVFTRDPEIDQQTLDPSHTVVYE